MNSKKYIYMVLDIAIVIVSILLATCLRFEFKRIPTLDWMYFFVPMASILTIGIGYAFGVYNSLLSFFGFSDMVKQGIVTFFVLCIFILIDFSGFVNLSGAILIIYACLFFILSSAVRGVPRFNKWMLAFFAMQHGSMKRTIIIGGGKTGAMVIKQFLNNKEEGIFPVAILDDDETLHNSKVAGVKIVGSIDNAAYYAKKLSVEQFLIAIPSAEDSQLADIFDKVSNAHVPTKIFQSVVDIENYQNGDKSALKEISIEDLLFREPIKTDNSLSRGLIEGKVVMVTGGAGSIGSELCRQVLQNNCKKLVIFDIHENGLFDINEELKNEYPDKYVTCLGSVRDKARLKRVFDTYNPVIVFHAAAHKHVPMMQINPFEAVKNNIFGTLNVIRQTLDHKCQKFILISTDKAVNPTNVMGATKRACELLVKSHSNKDTEMVAVRFGNVLGSNGSVIPLFKKQIAAGGPVTVTHKDMTRYFMTIKEAVSLVLSAGASAKGSELFVLDMGQPVKIYDLAVNLIRLSGLMPFRDIDIQVTGLRPGEKLYEELMLDNETVDKTSHKKIFIMRDKGIDKEKVYEHLAVLDEIVVEQTDEDKLKDALFGMISGETCEKEEVMM